MNVSGKTRKALASSLAPFAAGVTKGEILIDEALAVTEIMNAFSKTVEIAEFEARLVALEKATAPPEVRYDA